MYESLHSHAHNMLIKIQDGYGPPAEFYQNGPYNDMPVGEPKL